MNHAENESVLCWSEKGKWKEKTFFKNKDSNTRKAKIRKNV